MKAFPGVSVFGIGSWDRVVCRVVIWGLLALDLRDLLESLAGLSFGTALSFEVTYDCRKPVLLNAVEVAETQSHWNIGGRTEVQGVGSLPAFVCEPLPLSIALDLVFLKAIAVERLKDQHLAEGMDRSGMRCLGCAVVYRSVSLGW